MDLSTFVSVPKYPQYLVSPEGEIWSTVTNKLFTKRTNSSGYYQTCFFIGGKTKYLLVSRVVASAFLGLDLDDPTLEVDHINGDISNNHYTNLQVLSRDKHLAKTQDTQGVSSRKLCTRCGTAIRIRNSTYSKGICKRCTTKERDRTEGEIEDLLKETGSWVQAAKSVGISDNGLRKMYKRVAGGKDPRLLTKKIKN